MWCFPPQQVSLYSRTWGTNWGLWRQKGNISFRVLRKEPFCWWIRFGREGKTYHIVTVTPNILPLLKLSPLAATFHTAGYWPVWITSAWLILEYMHFFYLVIVFIYECNMVVIPGQDWPSGLSEQQTLWRWWGHSSAEWPLDDLCRRNIRKVNNII